MEEERFPVFRGTSQERLPGFLSVFGSISSSAENNDLAFTGT
jgi:hypothetical protein